ncbi:MAG: hypothetical protein JNK04_13060 [Myxococcales bacterium]|nr:hypothetical protein [Myxococcales bacterium]
MADRRFPVLALLFVLSACGEDSTDSDPNPAAGELPCNVAAVIDKCATCHVDPPQYGAPMPLVTVADFQERGRDGSRLSELVMARVADDAAPMPPAPNARLDEGEIAVLPGWFDAGRPARAAGESCEPTGEGGAPATLSCEPDIVLSKAAPYELAPSTTDETKCFGIELSNEAAKRHITAIGPAVDNTEIVHHFLLFRAPSAQPTEAFDCALFPPEWELLYAWAPGAPAYELPAEAGFPIGADSTSHLVLQMHYNNYAGTSDLADDTAVELCTSTDLRPNDAATMAFGGADFTLPPNQSTTLSCDFSVPQQAAPIMPVHIFQSWPHMHKLGRSMKATLHKANGDEQVLVDTSFSFSSQLLYPTDVDIDVGDRMTTVCNWENTLPTAVGYGEASDDEMCFNIVTYYPAITVDNWSGAIPTATADCATE